MNKFLVEILPVPFDYGVKLINGRPGARFGPQKIMQEFQRLVKGEEIKSIKIVKHRAIRPIATDVKRTHEIVTRVVRKIIKSGGIPVVIGGGHDISFGSGKAVFLEYKNLGQINLDAHYDVRPVVNGKITSGTPFRRLLEERFLNGRNFVELGIHAPKNLKEHHDYIIQKKGILLKLDYINRIGIENALDKAFKIAAKNTNATIFDIDIDGVQKRFAPGCSAPCIKGFTKKQILLAAFIAGKNKNVKLFNLMEVNPLYDVNNKTVKLAAELIFNFIKGLSKRENSYLWKILLLKRQIDQCILRKNPVKKYMQLQETL